MVRTAELLSYIPSPKGRVWILAFRCVFFPACFTKQIVGAKRTVVVGSVWTKIGEDHSTSRILFSVVLVHVIPSHAEISSSPLTLLELT